MNSFSSNSMSYLLAPRTRDEEEAQLMFAIAASLQENENRDDRETTRTSTWSRRREGDEARELTARACRRGFVGDPFFDNFYPQKRLQQAQGELC